MVRRKREQRLDRYQPTNNKKNNYLKLTKFRLRVWPNVSKSIEPTSSPDRNRMNGRLRPREDKLLNLLQNKFSDSKNYLKFNPF